MELDYICNGTVDMKAQKWTGHILLLRSTSPYELEVNARGSSFHILCGEHAYGNFICIPDWNIGTELAGMSDRFWNFERLTTYYPELSPVDAISITCALKKLNEYISTTGEAG